jgi:hypothetical protein
MRPSLPEQSRAYILEHTTVSAADVDAVLEALHFFWVERFPQLSERAQALIDDEQEAEP